MRKEGKEQRQHPRFDVDVQGGISYTIDATVTNMSVDGAAIETTSRLSVGRKYPIRIFDIEKFLKLEGHIMWCTLVRHVKNEKGDVIPVYKAGVKFIDTMNERISEIANFIMDNKVEMVDKRLFGRFNLSPNSKVLKIDYQNEFRVKKISLSGMLIESVIPIDVESLINMDIKLDDKHFTCQGKIAHLNEVVEGPNKKYFYGIKFIEMSEENRKILSSYISSLSRDEKIPL